MSKFLSTMWLKCSLSLGTLVLFHGPEIDLEVSNTKSYAPTWSRAVGDSGRGRPEATRRRERRRGTCSPA